MVFHACSSEVNDAIVSLRKAIEVVTIQQITPLQQLSEEMGIPLSNVNKKDQQQLQSSRTANNNNNQAQRQSQLLLPSSPFAGITSTVIPVVEDIDAMERSGNTAAQSSSSGVLPSMSPLKQAPPTTLGSLMLPIQRQASTSSLLGNRRSTDGGGGGASNSSTTAPTSGLRKAVSRQNSVASVNNNAPLVSQRGQQAQTQQQYQNQISSEQHLENHRLLSGALDNLVAALEDQTMLMFKHLQPEEYEAKRKAKGESALKDMRGKSKKNRHLDNKESRLRSSSKTKKRRHHKNDKKKRRRSDATLDASSLLDDDDDGDTDDSDEPPHVRHTVKKQVSILGRHLDEVDVDPITGEVVRKDYPTNGKYSSSSDDGSSWDCTSDTSTSSSSSVASASSSKGKKGGKKPQQNGSKDNTPPATFVKHETTELTQLAEVLFTNPIQDAASIIERGGLEGRAALEGEKAKARQAINKLSTEDADRDIAGSKKAASECRKAHLDAKRKQRALERKALEAVREEDRVASLRGGGGTHSHTSKRRVESELEGITPTAFGQRRAEAEQLSKLKRKMEGDQHGKTTTGTYAGQLHIHPSDKAVLEALSVNFSCALQSCAHFLQASRARLYLPHHNTKTMKLVAACPDSSVVVLRGGQFIARNQGLPGAAASSGIAISIDNVTDDIRRNYLSSSYHGDTVESIFVMPIHNPNRRSKRHSSNSSGVDEDDSCAPEVIGVMEFINKASGQHWSEFDENMAYHTATLLSHFIASFGDGLLDLHQMPAFQLSVFHSVVPYTPAPTHTDLHTLNPPKDSDIIAQAMKAAAAEQQELQRRDTAVARGGSTKRNTMANSRQSTSTTTGRRLSFETPSSGAGSPGVSRKHTVTMLPPPATPPNSHHHGSGSNNAVGGYNPYSSTPLQRSLRTMLFRPQGEVASVFRKPVLIARVTDLSDVPSVGGSGISASEGAGGGDPSELFVAVPQGVFDTVDEEEVYKKRVRAAKKHASRISEIGSVRYVREMSAYLASLEDTSRTTMDELVTTRTKVNNKVDEILDLTGRIKVLENNCQYLNERLLAAQRQHLDRSGGGGSAQQHERQQSPGPASESIQQPTSPTSHRGGGPMFTTSPIMAAAASTTASSSKLRSPSALPNRNQSQSSSPSIPTDTVTLRAFLQQASLAADELKREALHLPALLKTNGNVSNMNNNHNISSSAPHQNYKGANTSSPSTMFASTPYFTPSEHKSVFESVVNKGKKLAVSSGGQLRTPGFRGSGTGAGAPTTSTSPQAPRSKSAMM